MVYYKPHSNLELTSKLDLPQPHICTSEVPYLSLIWLPQIIVLILTSFLYLKPTSKLTSESICIQSHPEMEVPSTRMI